MANASAAATVWNCPNYVGELFLIGASQTPVLQYLGGLDRPQRMVNSFQFPVSQEYSLESAAQPAITETASLTAPTPTTYVRSQVFNVCQIFQKAVSVSYAAQSSKNTLSGISVAGVPQPVQNELDFQRQAALKQIAIDVEYTILNGAYQIATAANVANKTRGLLAATTANAVAAGSARLTKDMLKELLRSMASNGAKFGNMVLIGNAFQVQMVSDLYGYAPQDRNVGGVAVKRILTDFCDLGVMFDPFMPTSSILIADLSAVSLVFQPVPGKGVLFYEELSKSGASETGQIYGQIGLDHGPDTFHGKITGLATS